MKWKYRIRRISFDNDNNDSYKMLTRIKREFKTEAEFLKECKKLHKYGVKKHGEGTILILTYDEH